MNFPPFYGQFEQDRFLFEHFFPDTKNGTFIEAGAADGEIKSNTYFFEQLGWKGLCIEPRLDPFNSLCKLRNCYTENVGLSTTNQPESDVKFLELTGWGSGLSGVIKNYDARHVQRIRKETQHPNHHTSKEITINTVPLQSLIDKYGLHQLDLLSLDIEGGELDVLKTLDWDRNQIKVILVENNYKESGFIRYLDSLGYRVATRIVCDEVYYRPDLIEFKK